MSYPCRSCTTLLALLTLLCCLTACGSENSGPPRDGRTNDPPPATLAPPPGDTLPQSPPQQPAPSTIAGTYQGAWTSAKSSAGGTITVTFTQQDTQVTGTVTLSQFACGTTGTVSGSLSGSALSATLTFTSVQVTVATTVSGDTQAITGGYTVATASGPCAGDAGQVTLVRAQTKSLTNTPVPLTEATMAAITGIPLTLTPPAAFDPALSAATTLTVTFPTVTTFTQTTVIAEYLRPDMVVQSSGLVSYGSGTLTLRYTNASVPGAGTLLESLTARLRVTASQVLVGGPRVTATVIVEISNAGLAQSQPFSLLIRVATDGTLVVVQPSTGQEIVTPVNVLAPGVVGVE